MSCVLCFGTFFSCNNVSNDAGGTLQNGAGQRTVILKGTISANSALPAEIAAAVSPLTCANGSVSRSAFPDINDTTQYYKFVDAVQTDGSGRYAIGRDDQDKFSAEGGVLAFELPLAQGHWEITTGIKKNKGGDEANDVTVLSDYCEKTVDLSEPVISHVFAIVPSQSGDADKAGSIELYVGSDTSLGADQLILLCSDEKFRAVWGEPMLHVEELVEGGISVIIDSIQSGNYEITFCFLKEGRHVFSTVQTISVFDYMKTNKWLPDGTGLISDSGDFYVTQDLANSQLDSAIYVGVHKDLSSVEGIDAFDSNSGHAYEPLRTLQAAVDKIAAYGNGATPYTIYVSGTLPKDKLQIPAALNSKARSLKICGLDSLADGTPMSAIDADGSGTALTVLTSVPVTLENIKITGGNNTLGGGICVASGADVTLKENAVVADNKASFGGGVYVAGSFTLDGGTIGDASAEEHATDILYSNKAGEKGGGLAFASTGKVTFKKGVVAYNYSKRGGGIATSFDARSDSSQLDFKGGEVRYNCAGPYDDFVLGGGLFLKGCKFYFTGGKVHHNYAGDGGGGIGLEKTVAASMSGGSVYDNEYRNTTPGTKVDHKWGSDILLFDDATLDMSGGKIYSSSQKDYGVMIRTSSCALNISGRAEISKETPVLVGDIIYNIGHDTYTYNDNPITIAGALIPPGGDATKKNAYIVPTHWKRGLTVINAPAGIPTAAAKTLVANNIGRFATTDVDFDVRANETVGIINAPICVAASDSTRTATDSDGKTWGEPSDDPAVARGTRSYPYAKMSQAVAAIEGLNDNTVPYEILINGTIKDYDYAHAEFAGATTGSVTIRGANGNNAVDILDADKLGATTGSSGGSSLPNYPVLKFTGTDETHKMSVTIQDIKICGGNNTPEAGPRGGGISASCADVSLAKGALIAQNKAYRGGGVGFRKGNLFIYADACVGAKGGGTATSSSITDDECSNCATDCGGGIYCEYGGVYLGYKNAFTVATDDDAWTGGVYRNWADSAGGICLLNEAECYMAAGTVSQNQCAGAGGGISIFSFANSFSMTGGKIESNEATEGGAVYNEKDFVMSGSAWIPYGGGKGKNDVWLDDSCYITIASALSRPTGASGANATITPYIWKRGTVIAKGKNGGQLPTGGNGYLALADESGDGWEIYVSGDNKEAKINAPIYVSPDTLSPPGSDGNIGTKSAPYLTVSYALTDLNDPAVDYKIYICGTIRDHVEITQTKENNAKSLLLIGDGCYNLNMATGILDGGCVASTPLGSSAGRTLWVKGDVPVTLEGIAIKGGKVDGAGGGILVDDGAEVTLRDYTSVTDNYATGHGAGVYVDAGGTLNVDYNVTVKDNKKVDSSAVIGDSNLFLPHGKTINVIGKLGDEHGSAEIWVSTYDEPTISGTIPITSGYKENNTKRDGTVVPPSAYFKGDKYGVALVGDEAALGANGGGITIDPMHDDVTFSADKTWINRDAGANKVTFTAKDGSTDIAFGDGDGKMKLSPSVSYHGEDVPQSGYWSFSSSGTSASLTFGSSLPAGKYVAALTGEYKGKTYSASYQIEISSTEKNISGTVTSANPSCSSVFNGRTLNIPSLIASDHEVTQEEYSKYAGFNSSPSDTYGVGDNYPAYNVSWYDALVYYNMRSMAERLEPVYVINGETDPSKWPGVSVKSGKYYGPTGPLNSNSNYAIWDAATMVGNTASVITTANGWRLPTEVEWEYLARGGNLTDTGQFEFSGSDDASEVAWWGGANDGNAGGKLHEVRQKKPNALGLYDMSGNVGEFVWDWSAAISTDTPIAGETPASPGTDRRFKGGYYLLTTENNNYLKISYRTSCTKSFRGNYAGFRVVRTVR